jgi:hypothetical protein
MINNLGDTVDIIAKTRLIGQLNVDLGEAERQRINAENEAFHARTGIDAVQSELNIKKEELTTATIRHSIEMAKMEEKCLSALKEKDALILEWMHSNEAFKKLARQYGKRLEISDEQRQQDFDQAVVDVSVENPKYAKTEIVELKKKRLGIPK